MHILHFLSLSTFPLTLGTATSMPPVCTEHQQQLFYNKKSLLELDVPPRKLLHRRVNASSHPSPGLTVYVPSDKEKADDGKPPEEEGDAEEGEVDEYSCDEFRMFEFKVRLCARGRSHDWTDCPFVHPGEKARRRDPRRYQYSGAPCPDYRRTDGACPRGDACDLAHGVFEAWLHPARYRTMPCKDGLRCRRKVCFFAHAPSQLRVLPVQHAHSSSSASPVPVAHKPSCCAYWLGTKEEAAAASATSPTSILMAFPDLSPPFSPQFSPPISPSGVWSRKDNYPTTKCSGARLPTGAMSYEAAYTKLLCLLEAVQLSAMDAALSGLDGGVGAFSSSRKVCKDFDAGLHGLDGAVGSSSKKKVCKDLSAEHSGPDLGWVEELLM